jgi:hypothetical protein
MYDFTMKKTIQLFLLFLSLFSNLIVVQAHPGGTDSSGCHVCRTNCAQYGLFTGQRHCHNQSSPTPSITPPTAPRTSPSPSTPTIPRTASSPSTNRTPAASTSSSDDYRFIVMVIALGLIGVITIIAINNGSSKKLDNSKLEQGIEDIRNKIKDL